MRTALVTGGSGGIRKGCGRTLAELGYDVVLAARREAPLRAAAEQFGACHVVADASDPAGFAAAVSELERIDLVVHAAGALGGTHAQADIRGTADNHVGQPGFVLRGDLRRATQDARQLTTGVHLVVGGT